jgi:hypothetical protein
VYLIVKIGKEKGLYLLLFIAAEIQLILGASCPDD